MRPLHGRAEMGINNAGMSKTGERGKERPDGTDLEKARTRVCFQLQASTRPWLQGKERNMGSDHRGKRGKNLMPRSLVPLETHLLLVLLFVSPSTSPLCAAPSLPLLRPRDSYFRLDRWCCGVLGRRRFLAVLSQHSNMEKIDLLKRHHPSLSEEFSRIHPIAPAKTTPVPTVHEASLKNFIKHETPSLVSEPTPTHQLGAPPLCQLAASRCCARASRRVLLNAGVLVQGAHPPIKANHLDPPRGKVR